MKTAKKALKAYCSANGKVSVQGVEFDHRPVQERKYPISAVLEILRSRNLMGAFDGSELTISHSALEKLIKAFPQLADDLLPYQQTKVTHRFGPRKPGVADDDE